MKNNFKSKIPILIPFLKSITLIFIPLFFMLVLIWTNSELYIFILCFPIMIILVYYIITKKSPKTIINIGDTNKITFYLILSSLVLIFIIFLFQTINVNSSFTFSVIILITISLCPGFFILELLNFKFEFFILEKIVLSFILSFIFLGFLGLLMIISPIELRNSFILLTLFILGIATLTRHSIKTKSLQIKKRKTIHLFIHNIIGLAFVGFFFLLVYFYFYNDFLNRVNRDVNRHYAMSLILFRSFDNYQGQYYILFHSFQSIFLTLSNLSRIENLSILVGLNLFLPLSVYISVMRLSNSSNSKFRVLFVMFYTILIVGGFTWIFYIIFKINNPSLDQYSLLSLLNFQTLKDVEYGFTFSFLPISVNLIQIFLFLSIIGKKNIEKKRFALLICLIIISISLTHYPELFFLIGTLILYGILDKSEKFRLNYIYFCTFLSISFVFLFYYFFSLFNSRFSFFESTAFYLLIFILLSLLLVKILRKIIIPSLKEIHFFKKINRKFKNQLSKPLFLIIFFSYLASLISLFLLIYEFDGWTISRTSVMPWFILPNFLGIFGIIAFLTIYYLYVKKNNNKQNNNKPKFNLLIISMGVFSYFIGRFFILFYFFSGTFLYIEKRIIFFLKITITFISLIGIIKFFEKLKKKKTFKSKIINIFLISSLIFSSYYPTYLFVDLQQARRKSTNRFFTDSEQEAIYFLENLFESNPNAWIIPINERSKFVTQVSVPGDYLVDTKILISTDSPEIGLPFLYRMKVLSYPYIYITENDRISLNTRDRFFSKYLKFIERVYDNSGIEIYKSIKPSFPIIESDLALTLPYNNSILNEDFKLLEYLLMSTNSYNYTVIFDQENSFENYKTLVLGYDPPSENITDYLNFVQRGGDLIVLNLNGFNYFGNLFLTRENGSIYTNTLSGEGNSFFLSKNISIPIYKTQFESIINFSKGSLNSCFISKKDYGDGKLYYVNINSFLENYDFMDDSYPNIDDLKILFEIFNFPIININNIYEYYDFDNVIEKALFTNVSLITKTLLSPLDQIIRNISIFSNGIEYYYNEVDYIYFKQDKNINIKSLNMDIGEGIGFYTKIKFLSGLNISFQEECNITVLVNDKLEILNNIANITINSPTEFIARNPEIKADKGFFNKIILNGEKIENVNFYDIYFKIYLNDMHNVYYDNFIFVSRDNFKQINFEDFYLFLDIEMGIFFTVLLILSYLFLKFFNHYFRILKKKFCTYTEFRDDHLNSS